MGTLSLVRQKRTHAGFSMIELMMVLAIVIIMLAAGIPSFQSLIQNQRMTTAANGLFSAINLTRSEAIKRGARVELVPIHGGGDWESGWAVLVDKNNNHRADAGDEVIFTHGPVHGGIKIESNQPGSAVQFLAYNGTGRAPPRSFRFILDGQLKRKISINFLGRPKVCNPATDDGNC